MSITEKSNHPHFVSGRARTRRVSTRIGWSARRAVLTVGLRGRVRGLVAVALGVVLLSAAVVNTLTAGHQTALADLDRALSTDAASRVNVLAEYFDRAQSINLLLAHDSVFQQFAPRQGELLAPRAGAAAVQAGEALAYLETLYPGRISEACMIDSTGTEHARVVQGVIIPASQMSHKEASNPFFAPTLRLPKGHVYQAAPYVSQDTHEWVISNSTPLAGASGRAWGMVHFEIPLDSFRPGTGGERAFSALFVDNRTGHIMLDNTRPLVGAGSLGQSTGLQVAQTGGALVGKTTLGRDGSASLRALVQRPGAVGFSTVDGLRMAVARVPVQPDNVNSWSVVSAGPIQAAGWSGSIGPGPMATFLAALLLLVFGGLNLRASRRRMIEARGRALIDKSSDLVLVVDRAGRASFLSPSMERLLGSHGHTGPMDIIAAIDPADRERFSAALQAVVPGQTSIGEFRITGHDAISSFEVSVQDLTADPSVRGLVLTGHDVTDRLALHQEMEHRALHDTLTGLANRALLFDRFEQALLGAARNGTRAGLLLLDLDRFKEVNDTFGHHYGDELLRQIGPRLTGVLRGVDTVARLGGDEFAVLLPDVHGVDDVTGVAAKLLRALAMPFNVEGVDLDVEASVGVVLSGEARHRRHHPHAARRHRHVRRQGPTPWGVRLRPERRWALREQARDGRGPAPGAGAR